MRVSKGSRQSNDLRLLRPSSLGESDHRRILQLGVEAICGVLANAFATKPLQAHLAEDDDGDGLVDEAGGDPDCAGPLDPEERPPVVPCDDGVDSDSDGVCDVDELRLGTNAEQGDSDGDHLSDADEIAVHGTNPALADSDGDGFDDDVELAAGRDPVDPTSGPPPVPSWDYAMPSRFLMRDPMSPQQGGDQYFEGELHPTEWMVDFDACGTAGLVFEYRWFIDDVLVENRPDCSGFQHVFASEGPYDVRLVAIGTAGEQVEAEQLVVVDDLLIFGLGDSYGSGEGNPDQPITDGMLEDYQALLDELTSLQNAAGNAVAAWQAALAEFNDLIGRVNFAFARLGIWADSVAAREAACPFPVVGCSAALAAEAVAAADLVWALGNIGVEDWNVANLPSYQQIWDKVDAVRAAGQATYSLALAARDAAQAAVAAAQGAVDFAKGELVAVWQNEPCHRSAYSGQVLAAQQIELSDPHTSVTFVHVACSGAQIRSGGAVEGRGNDLIGDDDDPDGHIPLNRQVNWLRQLAQDRTVDGVFVSIGGNDAQFANLITTCITTEPCFDPSWTPDSDALDALGDICAWFGWFIDDCEVPTLVPPPGEDANSMYLAAKSQLEPRYESLHRWLEGEYPRAAGGGLNTLGRIVQPGRVFLTEYPDFTRDDAGDYCGWSPGDPIAVAAESLPGVSQPEHQWAGGIVAPDLRDEMQRNAELYGWNFVTGISDPFSTHGYCATDPWIIRVGESLATQEDESGIAHPDRNGHQTYATALTTAFLPEPGMGIGLGAGLLTLTWLERSRRRSRACCERGDAA